MFLSAIITCSDKASIGQREDTSGKKLIEILEMNNFKNIYYKIVPDQKEDIKNAIIEAHRCGANLILTTGGTGFSKRDVTPEATLELIEKQVPGIPELIRYKTGEINLKSYLSRGIAGIFKNTLIINLPGSLKAVQECVDVILPILPHALNILLEIEKECGGK